MIRRVVWPAWFEWELVITEHAEGRMTERGVSEVDLRRMLERAERWSPSTASGRFMIGTVHRKEPWCVIVEPDPQEQVLVVVTAFKDLP